MKRLAAMLFFHYFVGRQEHGVIKQECRLPR